METGDRQDGPLSSFILPTPVGPVTPHTAGAPFPVFLDNRRRKIPLSGAPGAEEHRVPSPAQSSCQQGLGSGVLTGKLRTAPAQGSCSWCSAAPTEAGEACWTCSLPDYHPQKHGNPAGTARTKSAQQIAPVLVVNTSQGRGTKGTRHLLLPLLY